MYIVDRIEGNYVVCEDQNKKMHDILIDYFPENIKAGDVVIKQEDHFIIDQDATKKRAKVIKNLMNSLWED